MLNHIISYIVLMLCTIGVVVYYITSALGASVMTSFLFSALVIVIIYMMIEMFIDTLY